MADLLVLPRPAKSVQNGAGFSGKTGTYWACRKGKSGLSATEIAVGKNAGAVLAKRKRNRVVCPEHQICPEHQMGGGRESRWARAAPWRERGIRARAWRRKGGFYREGRQIPKRTGRASKKSLPRRDRRKHERVSERKSSPGRSAESWFRSKFGQT